MTFRSLSGRLLVLTVIFVMLAEVLIFVPSVARFRQDYLLARLERSQIASLALLATPNDMVSDELEAELLKNAGVINIVLQRDAQRLLILDSPMPPMVEANFDLRDPGPLVLMMDALACLFRQDDRVIRVIGEPGNAAGELIEITLYEGPLKEAVLDYGKRILVLSAFISIITAALLFFVVRSAIVRPIGRVVKAMQDYTEAPEDARRIIRPSASITELRNAEDSLAEMQRELQSALRQKERLALLGGAVARISHDLRNILTTAQLLADRIDSSSDPAVARTTPRLIGALDRANALCERTLAFGRAEEPLPEITRFDLRNLVEEIVSVVFLDDEERVRLGCDMPERFMLAADRDQLFRVLGNLVRNARSAIEGAGRGGLVTISARREGEVAVLRVADDGPGIPPKIRQNLFAPFHGSGTHGGSGLGLAIASELVRGHGGTLALERSDETGTVFVIHLPGQTP